MKCSLKTLILTVAIMTMKTMNITMKMIMAKEIETLICNKNKNSGTR